MTAPWPWTPEDDHELNELWHLSRTACCREPLPTRGHARRVWAAREFARAHPGCLEVAAYKRLERLLACVV